MLNSSAVKDIVDGQHIFFQNDQKTYFLMLGLCHAVAMSSSFTNPVMYGWCNTNLRYEKMGHCSGSLSEITA